MQGEVQTTPKSSPTLMGVQQGELPNTKFAEGAFWWAAFSAPSLWQMFMGAPALWRTALTALGALPLCIKLY